MRYAIEFVGTRIVDEYRGDRIIGSMYAIRKNDDTAYEVTLSEIADFCTCPAGQHGRECKHIGMARDYHDPADPAHAEKLRRK